MEVIEICEKRRLQARPTTCPPTYGKKCTRRYVQPARVESYAPERTYRPPSKPLDASTTYHLSYLNVDRSGQLVRALPFRPKQTIDTASAKFEDGTTNRLSYQPVWAVVKAKPIVPCRRTMLDPRGGSSMECTTTARQDYSAKKIERPEVIVPCGNIRTSSGILDATTTAGLSYMDPGRVERPASFKPSVRYSRSGEPTSKETTQKLSYQPFRVTRRETYPWAQKPLYKAPASSMDADTTYSKSYYADEESVPMREKAFVPRGTITLPGDAEHFNGKTVYSQSYLRNCDEDSSRIVPSAILPSNNIGLSLERMTCDTTNKLSYQAVSMKKRVPIRPRANRSMLGDGPMQSETTNRRDFVANIHPVPRSDVILPCDNIRTNEDAPLEACTTAALSYIDPGPILPVRSFKPQTEYSRPTSKIESDTVNKLSYQSWSPEPRRTLPVTRKNEYEPPKDPMLVDTIYHMSFPAPGYFIETEQCEPESVVATAET